ncbi:MAG: RdgB/HAM1 family non-canonical purine NTP pyrophosphatase [Gammaproteobacteria bacterium]
MRVVLASANDGKLREMRALLETVGVALVAQASLGVEPADETGASFRDNALIKARHAARRSGLPALADDSGLEVDALDGKPGVHSARYAGATATDAQNLAKLLAELRDVPDERRSARYRCSIAFVRSRDDAAPLLAEGAWEGRIGRSPRGSGGFGYDPIFIPAGLDTTAAELDPAVKNSLSHRGQALRSLHSQLTAWMHDMKGRRA